MAHACSSSGSPALIESSGGRERSSISDPGLSEKNTSEPKAKKSSPTKKGPCCTLQRPPVLADGEAPVKCFPAICGNLFQHSLGDLEASALNCIVLPRLPHLPQWPRHRTDGNSACSLVCWPWRASGSSLSFSECRGHATSKTSTSSPSPTTSTPSPQRTQGYPGTAAQSSGPSGHNKKGAFRLSRAFDHRFRFSDLRLGPRPSTDRTWLGRFAQPSSIADYVPFCSAFCGSRVAQRAQSHEGEGSQTSRLTWKPIGALYPAV